LQHASQFGIEPALDLGSESSRLRNRFQPDGADLAARLACNRVELRMRLARPLVLVGECLCASVIGAGEDLRKIDIEALERLGALRAEILCERLGIFLDPADEAGPLPAHFFCG